MTAQDTLVMTTFPVVVQSDCPAISRIYPLKQELVSRIFDIAKISDIVKKIYIFGSSVTGRCHIDSDLDICIDAATDDGIKVYELQQSIGDTCDWNCDIVMYSNIGTNLREVISQEGVVIYEQPAS